MDVDVLVDPEVAELLRSMPRFGAFTHEQLPKMPELRRAEVAAYRLSYAVERQDHVVAGLAGEPDVVVRVHRPKGREGPLPTIYFMHGGGYVSARPRWTTPASTAGARARLHGRLGRVPPRPRDAVPGPLDDCYAGAALDVRARRRAGHRPRPHRDRRGIARVAGWRRPRRCSPATGARCPWPSSAGLPDDRRPPWRRVGPVGGAGVAARGQPVRLAAYLGDLAGGDVPPYAAAARATDLAGLPPGARRRWVRSTASSTRTSTTPCASTTPVCPPSCTSIPGASTASMAHAGHHPRPPGPQDDGGLAGPHHAPRTRPGLTVEPAHPAAPTVGVPHAGGCFRRQLVVGGVGRFSADANCRPVAPWEVRSADSWGTVGRRSAWPGRSAGRDRAAPGWWLGRRGGRGRGAGRRRTPAAGRGWTGGPAPGIVTSSAPGMASASSWELAGGVTLSSSPDDDQRRARRCRPARRGSRW